MRSLPPVRFLVACLAVASSLSGCSDGADGPPAELGEAPPPAFGEWRFSSTEASGDYAVTLRVAVAEQTSCHAGIAAQGQVREDRPSALVGFAAATGGGQTEEGSRSIEPQAGAGPASATVGQSLVFTTHSTVLSETLQLEPGESSVFWAASGVQDVGGEDGLFDASLDCDGPFTILGRGYAVSPPLLWNDQSFRSEGYASAGVGGIGAGTLTWEGEGDVLVSFKKYQAVDMALRIESPEWTADWDLSGDGVVRDGRLDLAGPVSLRLEQSGMTPVGGTRFPWASGFTGGFIAADALPGGTERSEPWTDEHEEAARA